ncbi:hypothetical protein CC78DRAFT_12246 [Lojkania enalia]|uniref:DUF7730 domain-containing protein n=1 Tax=Lojkania enalia TaxID=147567 RepID=A0A9P4TRY9_9PLEO|nr:hypothetical protein CC78DRAFT_12246 [Didymosphaeria enalia]
MREPTGFLNYIFSPRREGISSGKSSHKKRFKLSPPMPRRQLYGQEVNEQTQCTFLTRLPGEIRNEIYQLVFSTNTGIYPEAVDLGLCSRFPEEEKKGTLEEKDSEDSSIQKPNGALPQEPRNPPAHPLSLLLTCRRINQEATVLAFSSYTFTITRIATYVNLKHATSLLSEAQFDAIASVAYDLGDHCTLLSRCIEDFLANCMLLFPSVRRLEIRVKNGPQPAKMYHSVPINIGAEETSRDEVLRKYVPYWWFMAVTGVVGGRSFSWQMGQKWAVKWPMMDSEVKGEKVCLEEFYESNGRVVLRAMDGPEELLRRDGIELCKCGCGEVCWLRANLMQEGGRRVEVEAVFYGDSNAEREKLRLGLKVRLREGAEPLPVQEVEGGIIWDADEAYWEGLRKRNGGWPGYMRLVKGNK